MNFYVDIVNGKDISIGKSLETAVKTIFRAQELVRAAVKTADDDVTVYIRGGYYFMDKPLHFDGELDSLPDGKTATYKCYNNEKVYISGGVALDNWNVSGGNIVKTAVPEGFNTRDLYVNGKPAVRARTPKNSISHLVEWDGQSIEIKYNDGGELGRAGGEVEIVFQFQWNIHRVVTSASVENDYSVLTIEESAHKIVTKIPFAPTKPEDIWYIENSIVFLKEPGDWYFDKSEKAIYYMLRDGESAKSLTAYAGVSEVLITSDTNSTLKNTTFEGLIFCNTTWLRPELPGGFSTRQAGFYMLPSYITTGNGGIETWQRPESAINLFQTDGVQFIGNRFINLGNSAIDMERAKNARISGNLFTDCGGSALILSGFTPNIYHSPENESIITENCEISNNYIHHVCTNMISNCGVIVGYGRNIDFFNNTLHDLPYSGLSYGWGWGSMDFASTPKSIGGRIANNHIYKTVTDIIDGGAIYTQSSRVGLIIENNYIHDNGKWFGGIYLDNRSAGYTIRGNVIHDCPANFEFHSYNTKVYDNYLDGYSQSVMDNWDAKVVFVSFKDKDGNMTAHSSASAFGIVGMKEWESLNNTYTVPSGDHTSDEAKKIISAAGVKPEYKTCFEG